MLSRPSFSLKLRFWFLNFPNRTPLRGCLPCILTEKAFRIPEFKSKLGWKNVNFFRKVQKRPIFSGLKIWNTGQILAAGPFRVASSTVVAYILSANCRKPSSVTLSRVVCYYVNSIKNKCKSDILPISNRSYDHFLWCKHINPLMHWFICINEWIKDKNLKSYWLSFRCYEHLFGNG